VKDYSRTSIVLSPFFLQAKRNPSISSVILLANSMIGSSKFINLVKKGGNYSMAKYKDRIEAEYEAIEKTLLLLLNKPI
jgi:hypothetical protein